MVGIIKKLPENVARKIAAGEVIERPASILRELIDNSIDANANEIDVHLKNGGIDEIIVIDNGIGMEEEDLKMAILPHSTSKIKSAEDIYNIKTLGFRGEALASITVCSKTQIISKLENSDIANSITVFNNDIVMEKKKLAGKGTKIVVQDIFYNLPGRKNFISSPASETIASTNIFIEKSVTHPNINFKLFLNDKIKFFVSKESYRDRVCNLYTLEKNFIVEFEKIEKDFKINFVCSSLSVNKKDRKMVKIFVNGRQINDYGFVQAVEYGYSEFLPGGVFPIAFIFIQNNEKLIDFNIHPAKKEVKIKNKGEIHKAIVTEIKNFLYKNYSNRDITENENVPQIDNLNLFEPSEKILDTRYSEMKNFDNFFIREKFDTYLKNSDKKIPEERNFIYKGQIFNLFLLVETADNFYIIDQHAAHEKIRFEELKKSAIKQELLIPIEIDDQVNPNIENYLQSLKTINIYLEKKGNKFIITALPQYAIGKEEAVIELLKNSVISIFEIEKQLLEQIACKGAVKDGALIDSSVAIDIIEKSFNLDNPRCPHGRPIWYKISRDELFQLVGRII